MGERGIIMLDLGGAGERRLGLLGDVLGLKGVFSEFRLTTGSINTLKKRKIHLISYCRS